MTDWERLMEETQKEKERMLNEGKLIALEKWKQHKVDHVNFIFSCGGDSMEDTNIEIYIDNVNTIEVPEIENYFGDAVYENVTFYVDSDGHYMGESGTVVITLDDDDDFVYDKESTSEYLETKTFTEKIELTDEEVEFINKYVSDINGNMAEDDYNINYKSDFVQTENLIEVEKVLMEKLQNFFENYEPDLEELSTWHTMEVNSNTLNKEDKTIDIVMNFEYYLYDSGID